MEDADAASSSDSVKRLSSRGEDGRAGPRRDVRRATMAWCGGEDGRGWDGEEGERGDGRGWRAKREREREGKGEAQAQPGTYEPDTNGPVHGRCTAGRDKGPMYIALPAISYQSRMYRGKTLLWGSPANVVNLIFVRLDQAKFLGPLRIARSGSGHLDFHQAPKISISLQSFSTTSRTSCPARSILFVASLRYTGT
ncbi:hypothetical protein VDGL01_06785 [Verticillium dahliae]